MNEPTAGPSTSGSLLRVRGTRKTKVIVARSKYSRLPLKPALNLTAIQCCVQGCGNDEETHPGKVYYEFPEEERRRTQWLQEIHRTDLEPSDTDRVCSDHFSSQHYNKKGALRQDALPSLVPQDTRGKVATGLHYAKRKRKPIKDTETQTQCKQPRIDTTKSDTEDVSIHIKEEFDSEHTHKKLETVYEQLIQPVKEEPNAEEQCIPIETQCQDEDPLAIVKSEPGTRTTATQTFTRIELYLSVACTTGVEHIDIPQEVIKPKMTSVMHTQTTAALLAHFTDSIKKQMKEEIRVTKRKTKMLSNAAMDKKKFLQCCETYLNKEIAKIVKLHSRLQEKYAGNRYGHEFKVFSQNLCLSNPESYKFFEKIFILPSRTTLLRFQMPVRTGTNPNFIEYLKVKVSKMTEKEKLCAICFDVMRISRNLWYEASNDFLCGTQEIDQVLGPDPAEYGAVLMIRGLYTKWTQPVSFAFMTEKTYYPELKEWLHKTIGMMFDIGLDIKVLTTDLENCFLDVSLPDGQYYFEIDGRRIYHFYDVRCLFKNARDALIRYKFHIGTKVAQWSHILNVYDKDCVEDLSLMPEITDAHVRPSGDAIDDVNLAIQIFSNIVAAAMNFYVIADIVKQKTRDTIELIAKMSNLYDILASKSLASAYKGTDQQNKALSEGLEYLQELQVKDKSGNIIEAKFVTGLKVNIKTAVALLAELKQEGHQYLVMKVLNKDSIEEYFGEVRRLGGNCCERPTAIMFARSFRRLFFVNLVNKDGDKEQDLKSTLYKIIEYMKTGLENKQETEFENVSRVLGTGTSAVKIQWPSTEYIAGFLVWKCLEKHLCEKFIENLSMHCDVPVEKNGATLLENFRKYNAENVSKSIDLLKPPGYLVDFVDIMEEKFWEYYSKPDREPMNFVWNTYRFMEGETFELPCECFPLTSLKLWFIRLKIEHWVREHNKLSKNTRKPRHQQKKQTKVNTAKTVWPVRSYSKNYSKFCRATR